MDEIFGIMCDVARLVTRGSDAARIEARRDAAQREERAAARPLTCADQSVAAASVQPIEKDPVRLRKFLRLALVLR
jgi:hypothetical protein